MSRESVSKRLPNIPGHLLRRPRHQNAGASIHYQPCQQARMLAYATLDVDASACAVGVLSGKRCLQREVARFTQLSPVVLVQKVLIPESVKKKHAHARTQQLVGCYFYATGWGSIVLPMYAQGGYSPPATLSRVNKLLTVKQGVRETGYSSRGAMGDLLYECQELSCAGENTPGSRRG